MNPIEPSPFKDSPIFWIQKIPSNWETKPVKRVMSLVADSVGSEWTSTELLSLTQNGVIPRDMESGKGKFPADFSTYQLVCNDQLVMCLFDIDETPRTVGLARQSGMITGAYSVFSFIGDNNPRFFYYFFLWLDIGKALKPFYTGLRKVVRPGTFASLQIPVPPSHEQKIISIFLDRETAKIDALIAEQQRLIELLQEKRQAVISHAVTKGLNPNAPMKDSGVEWLGEVPEHWRVIPLRWAAKCCSGDGLSSTEIASVDDDVYTVRVIGGNGLMGYANQAKINYSLLAIGRVGALCGNVHIVHPPAWITDNALILDPDSSIFDLGFLSLTLQSRNLNEIASKTAQPLITGTQVSDQRIPCPPLSEQQLLASYLTQQSEQFDTLSTEAQRAIVLLQERRSALISAAVTGQIDVRGLEQKVAA